MPNLSSRNARVEQARLQKTRAAKSGPLFYGLAARKGPSATARLPRSAEISTGSASGGELLRGRADGDLHRARLLRLRHFTHQIDVQQPVHQRRAADLDVVGQLEATLEGAPGDAAMQEGPALLLLLGGSRLGADGQRALGGHDLDLVFAEAGHRHGDAV